MNGFRNSVVMASSCVRGSWRARMKYSKQIFMSEAATSVGFAPTPAPCHLSVDGVATHSLCHDCAHDGAFDYTIIKNLSTNNAEGDIQLLQRLYVYQVMQN